MSHISKVLIAVALAACGIDEPASSLRTSAADTTPITMPPALTLADWDRLQNGPFYDLRSGGSFFTVISMAPANADGRSVGWEAVGADLQQRQIAFHLHFDDASDLMAFQHRLAKQITRRALANPVDKIHHGMGIDLDRPPPPPCCLPGGDDWAQAVVLLGTLNAANTDAAFDGTLVGP
jgi:hypothetical protein